MPVWLILKLLRPFVQRKAADRVAGFLEDRHTRRLLSDEGVTSLTDCPPCPPCPEIPVETDSTPAETEPAATTLPWGYALSGLLVGSALSAVAFLLARRLASTN